jgi:hypothetical protein
MGRAALPDSPRCARKKFATGPAVEVEPDDPAYIYLAGKLDRVEAVWEPLR